MRDIFSNKRIALYVLTIFAALIMILITLGLKFQVVKSDGLNINQQPGVSQQKNVLGNAVTEVHNEATAGDKVATEAPIPPKISETITTK